MFGNNKPWYVERWHDEDLANAMDAIGVPVTSENLNKMKVACKGIFADKSFRNEMLEDKADELFAEKE